jgi:hypothetical protein
MAREDEVKLIAYRLWEEDGCCHGRDVAHWLRAEMVWQEQNKEPEVKQAPVAARAKPLPPTKKPGKKKSR